jgi:hypothetical protein
MTITTFFKTLAVMIVEIFVTLRGLGFARPDVSSSLKMGCRFCALFELNARAAPGALRSNFSAIFFKSLESKSLDFERQGKVSF